MNFDFPSRFTFHDSFFSFFLFLLLRFADSRASVFLTPAISESCLRKIGGRRRIVSRYLLKQGGTTVVYERDFPRSYAVRRNARAT